MAVCASQSQGLGIPSDSPMWLEGTQILETCAFAFSGVLARTCIESGAAGTQTGCLIWDVGIKSGALNCCATMLPCFLHS